MKSIYKLLVLSVLALLALNACNQEGGSANNAVREEMENRKIKRIPTAMLMDSARKTGQAIVQKISAVMLHGMEAGTSESCRPWFNTFATELPAHGIFASRYALLSKQLPTGQKEAEVIEAYRYSISHGTNPGENLQTISDTSILFNTPIVLTEGCLKCHGDNSKNNSALTKAQPQTDTLTGFKNAAIIGVYSINMRRENLIKSIHVKY